MRVAEYFLVAFEITLNLPKNIHTMKMRLIMLTLVFPMLMQAQIVITQSDMPSSGDTIRHSNTVDIGFIDFEATGPNFNWDFSGLVPFTQSVDSFVSVSETPLFYQLLFFFTANLAKKEYEFDQFPGFQVTDSYRYFKNSSSSFQEVGFAVSLNGLPLPTLYDDADIIYTFPLEDGTIDSSFASYEFDIPGLGFYGGWKKRNNEVDGWGQLTTPFGTFEALRLKTEILQYDSLYIDSLGFGIPFYQELTEYKWLGEEMGLPLVHVTDNGLVQTVSYIDSVRVMITGSKPEVKSNVMHVYPNPAHRHLRLEAGIKPGEQYSLKIVNMAGKVVHEADGRWQAGALELAIDPRVVAGSYLLLLHSNHHVFSQQIQLQ